MKDYSKLTRAELIECLAELEKQEAKGGPEACVVGQSKEKLADSELADSAERLRAILDTAVEGIITIDGRGVIESLNPAAEKTFGWKTNEVIGRNVSILMPSPDRERHDGYIANYLRTGQAKIIGIGREVVGQKKDGSLFPMDLAVSEVRLTNQRLFAGFVRDITERKRLEQEILEISDRERQRLGQDLHDGLCQHLAGIELMSQVLEQKLAPKSKADAARVADIAKHVRDTISQTRLLARGLFPVTLESEGLKSALEELAVNTEKIFGITCRLVSRGEMKISDLAAATHLYRIAQEAVSNAFKHGKASKVTIELNFEAKRISLRVRDNGIGFSREAAKNKGMGLRIMQYRAGMVGGALTVEPNSNGGTSVVCLAPIGVVT
jgi:two-component system, LuxR family, sensor kinase FixL